MGAPIGNQNAAKARLWRDAIHRALAKAGREKDPDGEGLPVERGLKLVAEKFINSCIAGEAWALKDLGDRLDGRPAQAVSLTGADEGPIQIQKIERVVVNAKD